MSRIQMLAVADREDGATGAKRVWGYADNGGAGGQSPRWGLGGESPRSWSINAFCVMVKAFS